MPKKILKKLNPKIKRAQKKMNWYQMSVDQVLEIMKTDRKQGLTDEEVEKRRKKYGINTLPRRKRMSSFSILISQIKSPLVYILIIAAVIAALFALLHEGTDFIDSIVITAAVVINVIVGFFQERKAQHALEALQKIVTARTTVIREGERRNIIIEDIIPGDILQIEAGDKIPADCRLIETADFLVDESALTGESEAVSKDTRTIEEERITAEQNNMIFMGTVAVTGSAKASVVNIGSETQIGKIARMVAEENTDLTPLQKKLAEFSKKLSIAILFIAAFIFFLGLITRPLDVGNIVIMFETAVAVAVAAIPGGLVVAVTIVLAVGMQRILKEKALVRKLLAAEILGSTTVICTDKTGTITEGKMHVAQIVTEENTIEKFSKNSPEISKYEAEEFILLLRIGMICNNAYIENPDETLEHRKYYGSSTEIAILAAASDVGMDKTALEKETPRLDVLPFESSAKYMATLNVFSEDENIVYLKGAPEIVIDFCSRAYSHAGKHKHKKLTDQVRKKIERRYERMSRDGLRVLALAYKKVDGNLRSFADIQNKESDFVFVGFVGIKDPLRSAAHDTVEICKKAGIHVVMITGDHRLTARAIGYELGINVDPKNVIEGKKLSEMNESEFEQKVEDISVYARVSPEDKLRIVKAWQAKGEIVAMTGDGVNDAPALRTADIGVALGSGTEVAKETSDLVLLDDDFSSIVTAVREGRVIYDNIRKIVLYFLSDSFTEVLLIIATLLFGWPLPILVAQILYVNIIADGLPALSIAREPADPDIMEQNPQERNKPILDRSRVYLIAAISGLSFILGMALFEWSIADSGDISRARTVVFTFLVFKTLLYTFSIRSMRRPIWKIGFFSNKYLIISVLFGALLQLIAVYVPFMQKLLKTVPLYSKEWALILAACFIIMIMIEISKFIYSKSNFKFQKSKPQLKVQNV